MYFIHVLVVVVAILTILASLALVFGSDKKEKVHSLWMPLAAIGEASWAVSIAIFLSLGNDVVGSTIAPWLVRGIYLGAIVMNVAILGYILWKNWSGKIVTLLFMAGGILLGGMIIGHPGLLYTGIILTDEGASVALNMHSWLYIIYAVYLCSIAITFCATLFIRMKHAIGKKKKHGYLYAFLGLAPAALLFAVFNLLMPVFRYDLIWVGPLAVGLIVLGFYFAIVRFKIITLNSIALRILSTVVIIVAAFILYFLIFHLVFAALFRVPHPAPQVIILNFIMIAIVLALMPAYLEIVSLTKSLVMTKKIDLAYIVKKLSANDRKKPNLKEVSGFLAEHMHFSYVAFYVNDKLYIADDHKIAPELLTKIAKLPSPDHRAWQDLSKLNQDAVKEADISKVAVLAGANGEIMGQMIFGHPLYKTNLLHKDLVEMAMIASLIGTMIEDGTRKS